MKAINKMVYVVSVNTENYMQNGFWSYVTKQSKNMWQIGAKIGEGNILLMSNDEYLLKIEAWN